MKKNEEKVGTVVALGSNGEGVLKQDGTIVFVPFTLVGEKIKYKVLKTALRFITTNFFHFKTKNFVIVYPQMTQI